MIKPKIWCPLQPEENHHFPRTILSLLFNNFQGNKQKKGEKDEATHQVSL